MDYEQQEKIQELVNYIKTSPIDEFTHHFDKKVIEADLIWEASRFWAQILYKCQPLKFECSLADFNSFKEYYERTHSTIIDSNKLFQNFWLRNILGFIEISESVRAHLHRFKSIINLKNELEFLSAFYPTLPNNERKINKNILDDAIAAHNSHSPSKIESNNIYSKAPSWLSEKDNIVEFSNIDLYFKPYLDYWKDFKFITEFYNEFRKDTEGLLITKSEFIRIQNTFKSIYDIPSFEKFIKEGIIKANGADDVTVNFYNSEPRYWSNLHDKISSYFWELLCSDGNYDSDVERIRFFINQVSYWESSPDPLMNATEIAKKRFLDAAYDIIVNEPDINGIEDEFKKVIIDVDSTRDFSFLDNNRFELEDFSLNNSDVFELYTCLNKWEEKSHSTYLHSQNARRNLRHLVTIVVKHDFELERIETQDGNNPILYRYKRITELLRQSTNKPILLWFMRQSIKYYRREIIAHLLCDKDFVSFSFQIISDFTFPKGQQHERSETLWSMCIEIALYTIRSVLSDKATAAKLIFQIYRHLNSDKYDIPNNRNSRKEDNILIAEKEQKEKVVIMLLENSLLYNHKSYGNKNIEYFIPNVFNELIALFANLDVKPLYNNGTIQFPMLQWDGLTWLMKCTTHWKYKSQFNLHAPNIYFLTDTFFTSYMSRIEVEEIKKYNFFDKKEENGLPLWSEKIERLQFIDWIYPIYFIFKRGKLNNFLQPNFKIDRTEDKYHSKNQFVADKIRTHIGVLIQVLLKLTSPSIPYGFDKKELSEIKLRIEGQIIDYIKIHAVDSSTDGRIDLFNYNKEFGFHNSENEALLPQIASAINWFSNKEKVIDAIISTNNIIKILTVVELVTSEGMKEILLRKVETSNLKKFLEESYWIEIQSVLIKITQHPKLMAKIDEIVSYWEKNISGKDKQYENLLYNTKLLIAYYHNNEADLDKINEPENNNTYGRKELKAQDYKQFYRGLIRLITNPASAYLIFDDLTKKIPIYPSFALNRMVAKMKMAEQASNDSNLYSEVFEEWDVYVNQNPDVDLSLLGENLILNRIIVLFHLGKYELLDEEFSKLELPYQMLPSVLDMKIKRLLAEKKINEANILLEKAERYHQYSGASEIQFISDLKHEISGIDNIEELRINYNRIYNCVPHKLIRIFPEVLNGKIDLNEFITNEVALAVNRMLDKINSIDEIADENKYNDIVQLSLESRVTTWGWTVKDQTRKAFSESGKDAGEIDLDILDWNKKSFITCEAFILRDKPRVQSHIEKLVAYYTHQRKTFIVLIYSLYPSENFEKKWIEYAQTTIPELKFPTGFEINSKFVEDVSKQFQFENSAIKIGKSIHGSDSSLYHIFVNIKYKISTQI
ncbi:MAG: hypothetical protein POELPBGB_01363 [Bacteroidia bacterium]|nr:hypothetical protein [Bacteroidia bacterium]